MSARAASAGINRPYNFSAGPATLPPPVLERVRAELVDWNATGVSVMEMSHRCAAFASIAEAAEASLRRLLCLSDDHLVLFMQGGASMQFSCVVLNLLRGAAGADYLDTGIWSRKAIAEARRLCHVNVAASGEETRYRQIPARATWRLQPQAAYLHYTANETIGGVEFHEVPEDVPVPLVTDMSSNLLSRPLDVSGLGLIYAGAQKNLGIAGLTIVIVRRDLVGGASPGTPVLLDYASYAGHESMLNTPPTFAWYVAGLVFDWLEREGGLQAAGERNQRKAATLYEYIDGSGFYRNEVALECRSCMNVPFTLADPALDARFLAQAGEAGLLELKGHRSVGGMRASLYNAMSQAGVDALVSFMCEFARVNG